MKKLITIAWLFLTTCLASAQNADSVTISKLNSKAYHYFLSKPDSSIALANKALDLAGDQYPFQTAFSYFVLSKANWTKAHYFLSIRFGFKALKIYENTSHVFHWGEANLSLARTFVDLKNYEQAKLYLDKAHELATKHQDKKLIAQVYREKSFLFQAKQQYDSALYYCREGLQLFNQQKDTMGISILYGRMSRVYLNTKQFEKSLSFCRRAITLDQLAHNKRGLSIAYEIAAEIFFAINKKDSSVYFLNKAIAIDKDVRNIPNMISTYKLLAKIYDERKDQHAVIENLNLINELKDSLYNQSGNAQIQDILTKYELEAKEKTIQLLENERKLQQQRTRNQNLVIGIFGVAIILISLLALVFWRMRQFQARANEELSLKNQEIALQNEEIQSQTESVHEISKLKSKLLSVISHDLRGPITNLQSLLSLVTEKAITPEEFKELSAKLKSHLNVSQRTLQNLLSWSLSQMEGIKTEPITFDVNLTIAEVIDLNREMIGKKNLALEFVSDGPLMVKADIDQVNLILRNLMHNAVKFSRNDGLLKICAEIQNHDCRVSVTDTGVGMTESEVKILLSENEFFTRIGTNQEKGTGLGLLLCKDFIKRNGGKLSIESAPETGTRIEFTLPLG